MQSNICPIRCHWSFCHNIATYHCNDNQLIGNEFRCENHKTEKFRKCCATFNVAFKGLTRVDFIQNQYSKVVKEILEKCDGLRYKLCRGDIFVIWTTEEQSSFASYLVYDVHPKPHLWYVSTKDGIPILSSAFCVPAEFPLDYWSHLSIRQFGLDVNAFLDQIERNISLPVRENSRLQGVDQLTNEDTTVSTFRCGEKEYTLTYQCKSKEEFINRLKLTRMVVADSEYDILSIV